MMMMMMMTTTMTMTMTTTMTMMTKEEEHDLECCTKTIRGREVLEKRLKTFGRQEWFFALRVVATCNIVILAKRKKSSKH